MRTACETRQCDLWAAARRAAIGVGAARARQLQWVAGEVHRAHAAGPVLLAEFADGLPGLGVGQRPPRRCTGWLTGPAALVYLEAAGSGRLRARAPGPGRATASTPAAQRVRASVLRELAASAGVRGPRPAVGAQPSRPWTTRAARTQFLSWLGRDPSLLGIRTHAVAALAAGGLRVGETSGLTLHQVLPDGTVPLIERNPPGPGAPYLTEIDLPGHARAALRAWLTVRPTVAVSDRVPAVFLTLRPARARTTGTSGHDPEHTGDAPGERGRPFLYARGLPVSARSLSRTHAEAAHRWLHSAAGERWANEVSVSDLALGRLAYSPELDQ